MPYVEQAKVTVGDPTTKDWADTNQDNQTFLNNNIAASVGGLILNWSFETDADSDGEADGWDYTNYIGGSNALNTAEESGGVTCQSFTSTVLANGGGYIDTTDFIEAIGNQVYMFAVNRHGSVADISNQMQVTWYDDAQSSISTTTCYQDTDAPTTKTRRGGHVIAPATARYAKIRLEGGVPATGTATGVIYFDNVYFDISNRIITMGDFSSDTDLVLSIEQYKRHKIWLLDTYYSASDSAGVILTISTNRGSSYETGGTDYEYQRDDVSDTVRTPTSSTGSANIPLTTGQRTTSVSTKTTGWIEIYTTDENYAFIDWRIRVGEAAGKIRQFSGTGIYNGSSTLPTTVKLDIGTFTAGSYIHERF